MANVVYNNLPEILTTGSAITNKTHSSVCI